jgi:hypothetical protein
MKPRLLSILFTLLLGIISCGIPQPVLAQTVLERIQIAPGPEDMVLDTSRMGPRLIISCSGRRDVHKPFGGMVSVDLITGKQFLMERLDEPDGILFRPHGIYLDGDLLYVISHEKEPDYHPVMLYRVVGNQLHFLELIHTDHQHSPNALVTGSQGEIYLVNDSGKRGSLWEKVLKLKRATVEKLEKSSDGSWEAETVATGLSYPAGINRIGDQLFVGDAILNCIHPYMITPGGLIPSGEIKGLKGNDNIRIYQGQLLVPGHVKPLKFIKHAKNPEKLSPVDVFLANPQTGEYTTLYSTNGESISGGSTAIIYGKFLYISQVFDSWILKVELPPRVHR